MIMCKQFETLVMIGLIVLRGFPHDVTLAEARRDPSGMFQIRRVEQGVLEMPAGTPELKLEIDGWVAMGEHASRPFRPTHKAFHYALRAARQTKSPIVIDNVLRLYDGCDRQSASAMTRFLQDQAYPLISFAHKSLVHLAPDLFERLLEDRLNQMDERAAMPAFKKEITARGFAPGRARATAESRAEQKRRNQASWSALFAGAVIKIARDLAEADMSPDMGAIAERLNDKDFFTETGREWTPANLRKGLRRLREEYPNASTWKEIKL